MSLSSKSAILSSSPLSHWKLTVAASFCHLSFKESVGPHILKIFPRESTFIPSDVARSHLNSEKADSRRSNDTSATCELSMDWTCRPFSLQSKFTSLQRPFIHVHPK